MSENQNGWSDLQKEVANKPKLDPGKDVVTAAHNNMKMLIEQVSSATLVELTALRDEIDNLMIAIRSRNEQLLQSIVQHTEFCTNAIKTKQIVTDSVKAIQHDFNGKPSVHTVEHE